ncbi:MAG TPA: site-specific integrase [Mycobacteriales bacterium]
MTEAEVRRKVRELEKDRDAGRVKRPGRAWTVGDWLTHWVENIAAASVRPKTLAGYRTAVYRHLIPGIGGHRTDRLQPEHIEKLYSRMRAANLSPGTVHQVHRTLRTAMNEAVRRGQVVRNPAEFAKAPRLVEQEIEPFTIEEAQRLLRVARTRRNGVRYELALALGLRQGEALGLRWSDLSPSGDTLTVRRALQRHTWQHGCGGTCGQKRGAECPQRRGGGLVAVETKSRAGRRVIGVPGPLATALARHRTAQDAERERAGDLWQEGGWVFTQPTGRPVDPRRDYEEWRELLRQAKVRPARLHDARHTAATILLVLGVPTRAVMQVMGWSQAAMTTRYQHVPDEVRRGIATQLGGLLWGGQTGAEGDRKDDGGDGPAGVLVPT